MRPATTPYWFLISLLGCTSVPQTSYCEATCDWAVACHSEMRELGDEVASNCLNATREASAQCETSEAGGLDPATAKLLTTCTDAVANLEDDLTCGAFTGSLEERTTGASPQACVTQGEDFLPVFEAARNTTQESAGELCNRMAESFCRQVETCIVGDAGGELPQDALDTLGTPYERCISDLTATFVDDCQTNQLYEPGTSLIQPNIAREGALVCLGDLESRECGELFGGEIDPICGAAFMDTASALTFFTGLADLVTSYADF
jgi:hypothetical protein